MTNTYDIETYQGSSKTISVSVTDNDGDPIDITGGSARYAIYSNTELTVIEKENGDGIQFTDPENGKLVITIAPEDTDDVEGVFNHLLQVTDANGNVLFPVAGTYTVSGTPF